MKKFTAT